MERHTLLTLGACSLLAVTCGGLAAAQSPPVRPRVARPTARALPQRAPRPNVLERFPMVVIQHDPSQYAIRIVPPPPGSYPIRVVPPAGTQRPEVVVPDPNAPTAPPNVEILPR